MAKTIFIASLNPFVTRNILFTDVFKKLVETPDLRLVIFCPDYKKEYFEKYFQKENVIVEPVESEKISIQDIIFGYIGQSLLNTKRLVIRREEVFLSKKKYIQYFGAVFLSWIGRFAKVKKLVRFLDRLTFSKKRFAPYFDRYQPDLVFGPDVFHPDDVHFLMEAKYRGLKTVGMVRSWDNITNKGFFRPKPDKLIVNNEVIRDEAIEYEDIKKKNIFVAGMPQFDMYVNEARSYREDFFKKIGFDSKKPFIVFGPWGNRFIDTDWQILQILKDAIVGGKLPDNLQILVRIPPNDNIALGDFVPDEHFKLYYVSRQFQEGVYRDREFDPQAMKETGDNLYYADLIVGYMSSLNIDACVFDKPIVAIVFDGWTKKPYLKSIVKFLDFDHTKKMLFTRFAPFTKNKEELIYHINRYLKDPSLDRENRAHFLKLQTWKMDGQAGERIANFLISQLS